MQLGNCGGNGGGATIRSVGAWVVILEAIGDVAHPPLTPAVLADLIDALDAHPRALHTSRRCSLQLLSDAPDQADALEGALGRWNGAMEELRLGGWQVERAEVLTPEEFERDLADDDAAVALAELRVSAGPGDDPRPRQLLDVAFRDPLTGLANVQTFIHRVELAISGPSGDEVPSFVIRLGLDRFRLVNERIGPAAGDRILVTAAERVNGALRPRDPVGRLGTDHFGVLLQRCTPAGAVTVSERLLEEIRRPILLRGQQVTITASAGVAAGRPGDAAERVLEHANRALLAAKEAGGDQVVVL